MQKEHWCLSPRLLAITTLLVGLTVTGISAYSAWLDIQYEADAHFDNLSARLESDVQLQFSHALYGLKGARGFYAASKSVERGEFRAYVESRNLPEEFPGVHGFGFIQRVLRKDLDTFMANERADDAADFNVRTSGNAADLYIIKFIEPLASNRPAWGFDVGSEGVRRAGIESAIASGKPTITGRITLLQDSNQTAGLLYLLPVYRNGSYPQSPEERLQALSGIVYTPIVAHELLNDVSKKNPLLYFSLRDRTGQIDNSIFYDSGTQKAHSTTEPDLKTTPHFKEKFTRNMTLDIGERKLQLLAKSTPQFESSISYSATTLIITGGALISALLAFAVWLLSTGKIRAENLADRITADLRRNHDMLASLAEHAPGVIYQFQMLPDGSSRFPFASRKIHDIYEVTPEQVKTDASPVFRMLHPDDYEKVSESILESARTLQPWHLEYRVQLPQQGLRWRLGNSAPERLADGSTLWHGFIMDITDRKSSEEQQAILNRDLQAQTQLANALAEKAKAASHTKSNFLANMSHEIRTPMNGVLGMLQLLQKTELTDKQKEFAKKSESAAKSLLEILNDILDISKVEAGKMSLHNSAFNIKTLLQEIVQLLAVTVEDKPVSLYCDIDNDVPDTLIADELRIKQILMNLTGNAIKFTERGNVSIHVQRLTHDAHVTPPTEPCSSSETAHITLRFSVRDTGIGISRDNQAHIFENFSQAEASTTRRFGGTGLGLTICQKLVGLMGGTLALESAPGLGSHFYFDVSLACATTQEESTALTAACNTTPSSAPESTTPASDEALAGLRVLLVEDNIFNQQVACELLSLTGANVSVADNGQACVDALRNATEPFDAVLMDIQMPVMDGYAATAAIRDILGMTALPIIAMTANVMDSDRAATRAAGMDDHIGKPFELADMVAVLQRHTHPGSHINP